MEKERLKQRFLENGGTGVVKNEKSLWRGRVYGGSELLVWKIKVTGVVDKEVKSHKKSLAKMLPQRSRKATN